jgi:hypothetical protein
MTKNVHLFLNNLYNNSILSNTIEIDYIIKIQKCQLLLYVNTGNIKIKLNLNYKSL